MNRLLRFTAAFAIAGPVGIAGLQAFRAWRNVHYDFRRLPRRFEAPSPIEGVEPLILRSAKGHEIGASFVPPKNGVAVVLAHGTGTNRVQLWADAQELAGAGFGVLLFDWPGHGESTGEMTLGSTEREAFTATVDFLAARADVKRIGAYGFSNGAGLLSAFVPYEPRVTSLLAVNAWSDALEQTRYEYRGWGPIRQLPAVAAARSRIEGGNVVTRDAAALLKGRKTLFIASLEDELVPPIMSAELAGAAGSEVRYVEGAKHNEFREKLGDWPRVLVGFFAGP